MVETNFDAITKGCDLRPAPQTVLLGGCTPASCAFVQNGALPGQAAAMHENTPQHDDSLIDCNVNGSSMPGAVASPPGVVPDGDSNSQLDKMTSEQKLLHHSNGNGPVAETDKQDHAILDGTPNGALHMCTDRLAEAPPEEDRGDAFSDNGQPLQSALLQKIRGEHCAIKRMESHDSAGESRASVRSEANSLRRCVSFSEEKLVHETFSSDEYDRSRMRMQIPRLPRRIFSNPTDDSAVGYGNDRCSPPVAAAAGEVQSQPEFSLLSSLDSLYAAGLVLVQNSDDPHGDRASVLRQRGGQVYKPVSYYIDSESEDEGTHSAHHHRHHGARIRYTLEPTVEKEGTARTVCIVLALALLVMGVLSWLSGHGWDGPGEQRGWK